MPMKYVHKLVEIAKKQKTYNSGYSLVVTDPTTNPPIWSLCMAERTGCPVLSSLWSYVLAMCLNSSLKRSIHQNSLNESHGYSSHQGKSEDSTMSSSRNVCFQGPGSTSLTNRYRLIRSQKLQSRHASYYHGLSNCSVTNPLIGSG
jgi:hypothetical protein